MACVTRKCHYSEHSGGSLRYVAMTRATVVTHRDEVPPRRLRRRQMRPRWWTGRGATGAAALGLGLATAFVAGPTAAAAGSGGGDDIVAGALAALRDNAAVLGFD